MKTITLTNDFHNTSVNLRPNGDWLSASQVARAKRELCGHTDCTCSGDAGQRGNQIVQIEPILDQMTGKIGGRIFGL